MDRWVQLPPPLPALRRMVMEKDYVMWMLNEVNKSPKSKYKIDLVFKNGNYYGTLVEAESVSEAIDRLFSKADKRTITEGRVWKVGNKNK